MNVNALEDELLHYLHNPDLRRRVLHAGEQQEQRVRKRWFVVIVSAFAVLALLAAWYGAPPKAEEGYVDEEAVGWHSSGARTTRRFGASWATRLMQHGRCCSPT